MLPAAPARSASSRNDHRSPLRVLVVDDCPDNAVVLGEVMEGFGCDVLACLSGEQALHAAAAYLPDVVILDLAMPRLDGYEVIREMRRESWARSALFVAHSGFASREYIARSYGAGFHFHLNKPARLEEFQRIIETSRARFATHCADAR